MDIFEPGRKIPVIADVDVCVLGGSCTGVFAAVRAARLGATVAIIEKQNCFGGMATAGMVNIWHSILDAEHKEQIIGGLTVEVMDSIKDIGAVSMDKANPSAGYRFNSEELKIALDKLILEHKTITPLLHTYYCGASYDDSNRIEAVFIENKSGRQAIKAKVFIDATGDADVAVGIGFPYSDSKHPLPPTTCAKIQGISNIKNLDLNTFINVHREEVGLQKDHGWNGLIPDSPDVKMYAMTHVFDMRATNGLSLSKAEMEGRLQIDAYMTLIRRYFPEYPVSVLGLASSIGLRDSRRCHCNHELTGEELLWGKSFDDTIANGSYRVDVHNEENGGFEFFYLDGTTTVCGPDGTKHGRWREEIDRDPTYYQIPYRCMVRDDFPNLIIAGRAISVDDTAFGAVRVMVNLNQVGEAAGAAAFISCDCGTPVSQINTNTLRKILISGGSILL